MLSYHLVILVMVLLSAFFSGSEISFNASNKMRLKRSAEEGKRSAALALRIDAKFTEALSAILIGNNLANIAASTAATLLFTQAFSNVAMDAGAKSTAVTVVSTAVMTVIILIFGEITPKIIAKQHADFFVCLVAYPIRLLWLILFPAVKLVMLFINFLRRFWGKDKDENAPTVTEEELSSIIDMVEADGVIDEDKSDMLQSAIAFRDTTIAEIMTPRTALLALDVDDPMEKNFRLIEGSRFSRLPVYRDTADNIIGILSLNRFYRTYAGVDTEVDLTSLLMSPCLLHKTMRLPTALRLMRERHTQIAIVVDEFGGTMGIITLEDILEEIVGEIWDESDEIVRDVVPCSENCYEVKGELNVYDFFDALDCNPSGGFETEYTTVGGWATEMLHGEPSLGGQFTFRNLEVEVTAMEKLRITKLRVTVLPPVPEEDVL